MLDAFSGDAVPTHLLTAEAMNIYLPHLATEANIIQKSGAWYSYGDQRIGQGRENAKLFLKDNAALMAEVEHRVKESLGVRAQSVVAADDGDGE